MSEDDEFDMIPDPFTDVTEAEWSRLLGHGQLIDDPPHQASPTRSTVSTDYGDESLMDINALVELDRIEASVLQSLGGPSSSAQGHSTAPPNYQGPSGRNEGVTQSRYFAGNHSGSRHVTTTEALTSDQIRAGIQRFYQVLDNHPMKRPRTQSPAGSHRKGNDKVDRTISHLFEAYEEELTCPICCDLFVSAHTGNPCGHSSCGDCGWQWIKKSSQHQCSVCRAKLARSRPLIPNIAVDSLVEKHIAQLSSAGDEGWRPQGFKYKERAQRKEKWKTSANTRTKAKQAHKADARPIVIEEPLQDSVRDVLFLPSDDDSSYNENSADEQRRAGTPIPRRTRSSRVRRR